MTEKKEGNNKQGHHEKHKAHKKSSSKYLNLENIFLGLVVLFGVLLVINIILTYSLNQDLKKSTEAVKERLMPAKIELTLIKNSKCSDCFDISAVAGYIKSKNVNVTRETMLEFDSKGGKEMISKYNIEKVPAMVITGEIDKAGIQGLEKRENALLLTNVEPPYTSTATGKIFGRVILYNLKDSECSKCNNLTFLISQIKAAGVKIYKEKSIAAGSNEGKELIKKYNIGFAPTIILSEDAGVYDAVQQAWPQIGSKEADGSYVLRFVNPPFINLTTGKLKGLVDIIYLTDRNCTECYDVSQHREILTNPQSFAIRLGKEETYDVNDAKGKELVGRYNITLVPTIMLSNEIEVYPSNKELRQFFSVEKDGSYVFRRLSVVGTHRDLATNAVVQAQQNQGQ